MKSLLSSKTFWLAAIQAIAGVIVIFSTSYPSVGWLITAKSVIDIALRFISSQPVSVAGLAWKRD